MRVRQLGVAAGLLACSDGNLVRLQVPAGEEPSNAPVSPGDLDADGTPQSGSPAEGDAPAVPSSGLAGELLGYWLTENGGGSCLKFENYVRFLPEGIGEQIRFDHNSCYYTERGTFITPARYVLEGHLLTWMEPGSLQRFNVATGTDSEGKRLLGHHVYVRLGQSRWRSTSQEESYDAEGTLRRNTSIVDLVLDVPLSASGKSDMRAYVDVTLEIFDRSQAMDQRTRTQRWQQDLPAHLGPLYGEQALVLTWPSDVPLPTAQPPSLSFTHTELDSPLYQVRLVLPPGDPDVLLLAWSRWSEHEAPPPPGTPQPCTGNEESPCP